MKVFLGALLFLSVLTTSLAMKRSSPYTDEDNFISSTKRPRRILGQTKEEKKVTQYPVVAEDIEEFCFAEPEVFENLTPEHFYDRAGDNGEMFLSIYEGKMAKLEFLLEVTENFAECRYRSDKNQQWNLLEFAVAMASYEACLFLFKSNFKDPVDAMKMTAMEQAYLSSNPEIRALFDVRLPIPKKYAEKDFNFGLEHDFGNIRKFLRTVQWSTAAQNQEGKTALMFALETKCSVAVLETLINAGFSALGADSRGETVFHKLVFWHTKLTTQKDLKFVNYELNIVLPMIKLAPHLIDVPDNSGNTPLHYAMKDRKLKDLVATLIKAGAKGEHTNLEGKWAVQLTHCVSHAATARRGMENALLINKMLTFFAGLFDYDSVLSYLPREIVIGHIFSTLLAFEQGDFMPASSGDAYMLMRLREFPQTLAQKILQLVNLNTARKELAYY